MWQSLWGNFAVSKKINCKKIPYLPYSEGHVTWIHHSQKIARINHLPTLFGKAVYSETVVYFVPICVFWAFDCKKDALFDNRNRHIVYTCWTVSAYILTL